jgi:hypothetical protein
MQTPNATVQDILNQLTTFKQTLTDMVRSLPESAEGVRKLSKNCAIVSLSTIGQHGGILSASYYLSNDAKEELIARIERGSAEQIKSLIEGVLKSGTIQLPGMGMHRLPPNFLEALSKIWKG